MRCVPTCFRYLLFFLLLDLSRPTDVPAQFLPHDDGVRLKTMLYDNTSGELGRTIFHYGRDGVLRSELWMLDDHTRCSANYYLFDDSGRAVRKHRVFSDSLTSDERYAYDAVGHRVRERFSRSDGREGDAEFRWDGDGRLVSADCRRFRGWFTGTIAYRHDGDRLSGAKITRDGAEIANIAYAYDPSGRLVSETWRFGTQWSQTFGYEYETTPPVVWSAESPLQLMNGRFRVANETYDYSGRLSGPSTYRYEADGRLAEKTFERSDGLKTTATYVFDGRGSLVSSHCTYSTGVTVDSDYRYDGALRMTEKAFRRSDGVEGWERYRYDELGRLAGAEVRNMDFWITGTIAFIHDKWGRMSGGRFDGADGRDAELQIEPDAFGNVRRVHWAFADGVTQTYTFDYVPVETGAKP